MLWVLACACVCECTRRSVHVVWWVWCLPPLCLPVSTFSWKILPDLDGVSQPVGYVDDSVQRITALTNAFGNFFQFHSSKKNTHTPEILDLGQAVRVDIRPGARPCSGPYLKNLLSCCELRKQNTLISHYKIWSINQQEIVSLAEHKNWEQEGNSESDWIFILFI